MGTNNQIYLSVCMIIASLMASKSVEAKSYEDQWRCSGYSSKYYHYDVTIFSNGDPENPEGPQAKAFAHLRETNSHPDLKEPHVFDMLIDGTLRGYGRYKFSDGGTKYSFELQPNEGGKMTTTENGQKYVVELNCSMWIDYD